MTPSSALLLLADGRLPSGGHAHSGGVEAAIAAGRVHDLSTLEAFLRGRLATAGLVAAAFAAAATHHSTSAARPGTAPGPNPATFHATQHPTPNPATFHATQHPDHDPATFHATQHPRPAMVSATQHPRPAMVSATQQAALHALDAGLDARTPSPALRKASRAQGRALLRAGRAMFPVTATAEHQPVALGVVAAAAGLSPADAALVAGHGAVTGPATAAVRLLALDPYAVHAALAGLAPAIDAVAAVAATYAAAEVDELPAASAPLLDIGAEDHATWEVRLFAS